MEGGWMDGWIDSRMGEWVNESVDGWVNGWLDGRKDRWVAGRIDGRMGEWVDGWAGSSVFGWCVVWRAQDLGTDALG